MFDRWRIKVDAGRVAGLPQSFQTRRARTSSRYVGSAQNLRAVVWWCGIRVSPPDCVAPEAGSQRHGVVCEHVAACFLCIRVNVGAILTVWIRCFWNLLVVGIGALLVHSGFVFVCRPGVFESITSLF